MRLSPVVVAVAFVVGVAAAPVLDRAGIEPSARWAGCAAVFVAIGLVARRLRHDVDTVRARRVGDRFDVGLGILAIAFAGAARGAWMPAPIDGVDDRAIDRVVGVVTAPVVQTSTGYGARIDRTWIWSEARIRPGETIAATGFLRSARGSRGDAQPDVDRTLAARGAVAELTALSIERLDDEPGLIDRLWRRADEVRNDGARAIDRAGGDPSGNAALRGIALGDRTAIPPELDARWRALGIFHVLSVSGLHLAVIAGLAFLVLRRFVAAISMTRSPATLAGGPAIAIAIAYTLATGAQVATLRALVAISIAIIGTMLERPIRLLDTLGVAALILLAWRPLDLFDPGFQLSFTAAIVLAVRVTSATAVDASRARRAIDWLRRAIATSTIMTLATAPITAMHFHEVNIGGVIGNVAFGPAIELVALPLALVGLVAGADAPIAIASTLVGWIDRATGALDDYIPIGKIAIGSPLACLVLVGLAIAIAAMSQRRGTLIVATCAGWLASQAPAAPDALRVTFVDVGQGDGAIVELPTGEVWLVDAGGNAGSPNASAPGVAIARALRAAGHDHVDLAIISHPHPDHYLGLLGIDMPITEIWAAREPGPSDVGSTDDPDLAGRSTAARAAARRSVSPSFGDVVPHPRHPRLGITHVGDVTLEILAPRYDDGSAVGSVDGSVLDGSTDGSVVDGDAIATADPVRTVNDNSLVVAIRYRGRTILFTGDIEAEGEASLTIGHVDVVKVPHHGSPTSSTAAFVAATSPSIAVISCGRGNRFGFPSSDVIGRWTEVGAIVRRTDRDGAVAVSIDRAGVLAVTP